jgi:HNH endonuclease
MNVEDFSEKYTPEPNTGCWLWTDNVKRDGYGQVRFNGKNMQAHRVSWQLYRGEIPSGMFVCHHCDVKTCVNPDHLFIGDAYANIMDAWRKGRVKTPTARALGERHGSAKLTAAQVSEIRADRRSQRAIAASYGVTQQNILAIQQGKTWKAVQ